MKKLIYFISLLLSLALFSTANAMYVDTSAYGEPQIVNSLNFKAELKSDGSVAMDWDSYDDNLKYYKLTRSQTNDNPFYPEDSYIFYSATETQYTDTNPPAGKTYYRVCAITNSNERFCSSVATLGVEKTTLCMQVITYAKKGNECTEYPTPCDVPEGWTQVDSCATDASGNLELTVELKDNKPYLKWDFELEGTAPNGYKIAISTENAEPTYPVMNGDSYQYLAQENAKSFQHKNANADTYYYRVCLYDNGKCLNYSNAVSIDVPDSSTSDSETTQSKVTFSDVKSGIWFESYLSDFVNRGIIEGYSDGSFQPSRTVNRAEMAKMVVKALGVNVETSDIQIFCDVDENAWYQPYVLQLYFDNVIEGYTGGDCTANRLFKAYQEVTRAEGIKIILNMFGTSVEPLSSGDQTGFTDVDSSHWAAAYIRTAFSLGIVNGYDDGTFQPNTPLTRAEFVKMLSEAEEILR